MTKTSVVVIVLSLVAGYLLGNFMPLRNFSSSSQESEKGRVVNIPSGKGVLEVTVSNSDDQPMVGIEIDVAVQPGPPESWGVKEANVNGMASFELDPGTYHVFFNTNRFPSGYEIPSSSQKVDIKEGQTKNVAIVLERN